MYFGSWLDIGLYWMKSIEQQAAEKFPYPLNACVFVKKKVNWLRDRWIEEQIKK